MNTNTLFNNKAVEAEHVFSEYQNAPVYGSLDETPTINRSQVL